MQVIIQTNHFIPPWKNDWFLMALFVGKGYAEKDLCALNRARIHQQVLFLLDVVAAIGGDLALKYGHQRERGVSWSTWNWLQEQPHQHNMQLWADALADLMPSGFVDTALGEWVATGHKQSEWFYDPVTMHIFQMTPTRIQQKIWVYD